MIYLYFVYMVSLTNTQIGRQIFLFFFSVDPETKRKIELFILPR